MKSTKTILTGLLMVGLVAALLGGATYAYFSDTETSVDNRMIAGTIDFEVNGDNPWTTLDWSENLDDMKPGDPHATTLIIKNVGENPMDVYKMVTITDQNGGASTYLGMASSESEYDEGNDATGNTYEEYYDLAPSISYAMTVDGVLNTVAGPKLPDVHAIYIHLGTLPAGFDAETNERYTMEVVQTYTLDANVTNWAQGDILTFDVELYGVQVVGGAPAPTGPTIVPIYPPYPGAN